MNKNVFGDSVTDVYDKCGETGFCEMKKGDICTLGSPCPHQKPLTNEEYMQTCSSDELANTIFRLIVHGTVIRPDREYIKKWLKEKHND